ncbi:MAG: hypothetical protein ACOYBC_05590 [Bilifractor sp.]|jgi:hypothetical protein
MPRKDVIKLGGPFQDTIIAGLLGGTLVGSVLVFIQFLISRSDKKKEKHDELVVKIGNLGNQLAALDERMDEENADASRRRILVFDDELRRDVGHSEESYNQILDDIRSYEIYCKHHDEYKNSKAVAAISNIKETYITVKKENKFI